MKHEIVELTIEGMSCASCVQNIQSTLQNLPGVSQASVNFATNKASVSFDSDLITQKDLINAIQNTGYYAEVSSDNMTEHHHLKNSDQIAFKEFLLSFVLSLPLFLQMIGMLIGYPEYLPSWMALILASAVQFWCGWRFYVSSYHSLMAGTANMDVLIALGTTAAYLYSFIVFLFDLPLPNYFETSATIITLILLGSWLESKSRARASSAIEKLIKMQPKKARVKRGEQFIDLPIEEIKPGDIFLVRPGENIPVDGEVIEGDSTVNESLLTGESMPVQKKPKDSLFTATTNVNGILQGKALRVGSETVLAGMVRLVQQAQNSKAPIQKLADSVSAVFVPIVLVISAITFIGWLIAGYTLSDSLISAVAVLVIACPCALGLATPIVILVASGRAAELGILFKEAGAIEEAQKLDSMIFDKTGTLTLGKPSVKQVISYENHSEEGVMTIAAALEHNSKHPLAEAILDYAKSKGIPIEPTTQFESYPGKGVSAEKRGQTYFLGSTRFAIERGLKPNLKPLEELETEGNTICLIWKEKLIGALAIKDAVRPQSKRAISELNAMDIYTIMITGDNRKTASAVARELHIKEFYSEVLPAGKAERVYQLKSMGRKVGMVGDGINDAPSLAAAHVGFAIDTGSDIAIEASDVTLVGSDLLGVVRAIQLSKAAFRKIKQNLFFAFIYNILGIPLAAFGLLNPVIAAAAMAASSLCVVGNALTLKKWKEENHALHD